MQLVIRIESFADARGPKTADRRVSRFARDSPPPPTRRRGSDTANIPLPTASVNRHGARLNKVLDWN